MISTGNDIIALQQTNPLHTRQEKFYSKFLVQAETSLFHSDVTGQMPFENFAWLAWSIKESVFKFYKRQQPEKLFSPTKIVVQKMEVPGYRFTWNDEKYEAVSFDDTTCFCCESCCDGQRYFTRSLVSEKMIFTVANNSNNFKNICWGIKFIDDDSYINQSKAVRNFLLEKLKDIFPHKQLMIEKAEAGYPFMKCMGNIAVSFSHHGNYVAYSFVADE